MLLLLSAAFANGQTTHVWITRHALTHLPDGELRQVLLDNETPLINGAMFPDGGYAFSPQHPYAETAHWEPFQSLYLYWIVEEHGPPLDAEGEQHAAFLMGMASHGMADQIFDSLYMERSKVYDADAGWVSGVSMDEATDVWWALVTGPQEVPERWIPTEVFTELYAQVGIEATSKDMEDGQNLLGAAIDLVGLFSTSEDLLAGYEADYPWATQHLHDERDVPGAPRCEGAIVALYWQQIWARLHGDWGPLGVLQTVPAPADFGLQTDASMVESRISVVFARGLLEVGPEDFQIQADGEDLPFDVWLFYRSDSHVVHLIPQEDWPEDQEITVTVLPGLTDRFGLVLADPWSFTVSTAAPPPQIEDQEEEPRGCSHTPGGAWLLLPLVLWGRCRASLTASTAPPRSSGPSS